MSTATIRKIGRYDVVRRIGRGSQGSVFLGMDPNLERQVAIKVLSSDDPLAAADDTDSIALEGRITGKLRHPNVVSVYDAGRFCGKTYLVFEYVSGQTMYELLRSGGRLSIESACSMIGPLTDAIAVAHAQGITHLDLGLKNIMVGSDNIPRILDFGLSQFTSHMTKRDGVAVGTVRFMAPEHVTGQSLGPFTDVFALASVFYEMVAGRSAISGKSAHQIMFSLRDKQVDMQPILDLPHGTEFARFLKGAFEKDARVRYRDGATLKQAFERFLTDTGLQQSTANSATDRHSTVEFLLQRMRRKQDFPTMSRTLSDINRLTARNSDASADDLANVILKDYALTSKLLKLVNSSYYSSLGGEVASISHAIVILGLNQLRMTASGLAYIGQMKGASRDLKDATTKSFLSGLMARHLAGQSGLPDAEEAFICGLFQNLGENLVIYYFPEEYAEICELRDSAATDRHSAAEAVLGINLEELGVAVARIWQLPDTIVHCIQGPGVDVETDDATVQLRHIAVFANELCGIAQIAAEEDRSTALQCLIDRFEAHLELSGDYALKLLAAGMQKLSENAQIFEIDVNRSRFCEAVTAWVDSHLSLQDGA